MGLSLHPITDPQHRNCVPCYEHSLYIMSLWPPIHLFTPWLNNLVCLWPVIYLGVLKFHGKNPEHLWAFGAWMGGWVSGSVCQPLSEPPVQVIPHAYIACNGIWIRWLRNVCRMHTNSQNKQPPWATGDSKLGFKVRLSMAQGHLRTIKIYHKQISELFSWI